MPDEKKETKKNVLTDGTTQVNIEEPPRTPAVTEMPAAVPCPFCQLLSKNIDALKIHIENIHFAKEAKKNNNDDISIKGNVTCSQCSKCNFVGSKDELGEFTMVSQPIRLILVDCFVFHFFFEVVFHFFLRSSF